MSRYNKLTYEVFLQLREQLFVYLNEETISQITEAYFFANEYHAGQYRASGEEYVTHPIEVAKILSHMFMDGVTIQAALLHDVLEDTDASKEILYEKFGSEVCEIVDGVTKLTKLDFLTSEQEQAENFRKMFLAMAKDVRVIIIKLADRLHNMRTIEYRPLHKQKIKARETLEIYSPIAHRLGISSFRVELEEIGFSILYPLRFKILKNELKRKMGNRQEIIHTIKNQIRDALEKEQITIFSISGREKYSYSIYQKMKNKKLNFDEVMDVLGIRVIVSDVNNCYRTIGVVHNLYKPIMGRFKDYIAIPKNNGYQSLQTTLIGPFELPLELQIRTPIMNDVAENGIASHWAYKDRTQVLHDKTLAWIKRLLEMQKTSKSSTDFLENVKIDLYPEEVYVFTPKGKIFSLPQGATPVDMAFAIHTDLGHSCVACRIDGKIAPMSTVLKSGQKVEIISAEDAHPNHAWLNFVVTGKARSAIRYWFNNQEIKESIELGERLFKRSLRALHIDLDVIDDLDLQKILESIGSDSLNDIYKDIGLGHKIAPVLAQKVSSIINSEQTSKNIILEPLVIKGTEGIVIEYAKCCYPIPGDGIIGIILSGTGMIVHRDNCGFVNEYILTSEKCVHVCWDEANVSKFYQVALDIHINSNANSIALLTNTLAESKAEIEKVSVDNFNIEAQFLHCVISVQNRNHLAKVIKKISIIDDVKKVHRAMENST